MSSQRLTFDNVAEGSFNVLHGAMIHHLNRGRRGKEAVFEVLADTAGVPVKSACLLSNQEPGANRGRPSSRKAGDQGLSERHIPTTSPPPRGDATISSGQRTSLDKGPSANRNSRPPTSLSAPIRTARLTATEQAIRDRDSLYLGMFDEIYEFFFTIDPSTCIFSIDLEQYKKDHSINLEVGIYCVAVKDVCEDLTIFPAEHIINTGATRYINRRVPDNRFSFNFGSSILVPKDHVAYSVLSKVQQMTAGFRKCISLDMRSSPNRNGSARWDWISSTT
ncbi:hypothetical protein LTR70_001352 [Exophiala xenobiotica]|uniref:Gfd2/YDR514C-like C-terminal domain-containing protein n=1 Tax=Lithohypha guttulata TaxID=1690604 RepID=A0ABR0KNH3_9EURO|nr:hypothetical protein LTR24_000893 [Lithohypha guttulata]KAK5328031.1 hypothetical protein LTR70_001352 [Exophiala xenobiotica]